MKKSSLTVLFSFLLVGFLSAGCGESGIFGGKTCTLVGCFDGVFINISDERPDSLSITVYLNGETEVYSSSQCTNPDHHCAIGINEKTPETVTIEVKWENGEFSEVFTPMYEEVKPNGPGCPPTCTQASFEIDLSGE